MKKIIISLLSVAVILGGCAKVTEEKLPCTGVKPTTPIVAGPVVVPQGGSTIVYANADPGVTLVWTRPDNTTYTGPALSVEYYSGSSSIYGSYSVKAVTTNCESDPATFQVTSYLTVPCNAGNYNQLTSTAYGSDYFYNDPYFWSSTLSGYNCQRYSNTSNTTGLPIYVYIQNTSGSVYTPSQLDLDSTGTFSSGACYISYGDYHSVSGKIYLTSNSIDITMALCSARFKSTSGQYMTVTGGLSAEH
ncbi:MAG: hypothetical protein JST83_12365 [Bacteroidetes bacterium]|nr:hypothetical protein [Bacteroidota bacterium]